MQPMVSVIVPVYNVKPYLQECVKSILAQTYREIELILVDDGSTDGSGEMCDAYAKMDNRVIALHQKNTGPGAARNYGIKTARGDYIGFVDSDDSIAPVMYQTMMELAAQLNVEMVACGYKILRGTEKESVFIPLKNNTILGREEIVKKVLPELIGKGRFGYASLWNKLYRKDFLTNNHLEMEENRRHGEDWWFNIQVFDKLESFTVCDQPLYNYIQQNTDSLMRKYDSDRFNIYLQGYQQCKQIGEKYNLDLMTARMNFVIQAYSFISAVVVHEKKPKQLVDSVLKCPELRESYAAVRNQLGIHTRMVLEAGFVLGAGCAICTMRGIRIIRHRRRLS